MSTFDDLEFKPVPKSIGGHIQAKVFFPNGFGASVVRSAYTYGGADGLYELAVLKGTNKVQARITYDTPITDDVEGYLKPEDVTRLLGQIEALEPTQ